MRPPSSGMRRLLRFRLPGENFAKPLFDKLKLTEFSSLASTVALSAFDIFTMPSDCFPTVLL